MRATKDQRWAAVYGAAYVYWAESERTSSVKRARELAEQAANDAIAAEPEEVEDDAAAAVRISEYEYGCGDLRVYREPAHPDGVGIADGRDYVVVSRDEAAALARLLARFAETGEL